MNRKNIIREVKIMKNLLMNSFFTFKGQILTIFQKGEELQQLLRTARCRQSWSRQRCCLQPSSEWGSFRAAELEGFQTRNGSTLTSVAVHSNYWSSKLSALPSGRLLSCKSAASFASFFHRHFLIRFRFFLSIEAESLLFLSYRRGRA